MNQPSKESRITHRGLNAISTHATSPKHTLSIIAHAELMIISKSPQSSPTLTDTLRTKGRRTLQPVHADSLRKGIRRAIVSRHRNDVTRACQDTPCVGLVVVTVSNVEDGGPRALGGKVGGFVGDSAVCNVERAELDDGALTRRQTNLYSEKIRIYELLKKKE
jgi:hypothetical protein